MVNEGLMLFSTYLKKTNKKDICIYVDGEDKPEAITTSKPGQYYFSKCQLGDLLKFIHDNGGWDVYGNIIIVSGKNCNRRSFVCFFLL